MATGISAVSQLLRPSGADTDDAGMLRLHQNESPYGAPAAALDAAVAELSARHSHYPDHQCTALRARVAGALAVRPELVAAANGADELIQLLALSRARASKDGSGAVAVTERTFPGYAAAASVAGVQTIEVPLTGGRVTAAGVVDAMRAGATLAYICNPHNPHGTALDGAAVEEIIAGAEATGAVAVFDEAYIEFADPGCDVTVDAIRQGRPAVVLRTFSKAWGLAALRVGYAVGPADLMEQVRRTRQSTPFSVNRLAQRAAIAALDHPDFVAGVRQRTAAARNRLCAGLRALGVGFVPSQTNFVLARLDAAGGAADSGTVADLLAARHRVLVRDLGPLGLPGCLRVTVGTEEQVDRFCAALAGVLTGLSA